MRNKRLVLAGIALVVLVVAGVCVAASLGAFRSDAERAQDAVAELMASYVVPVPNEEGEEPEDAAWPADDYGDAATMEALGRFGVDADEWRRHCLGNLTYEVGEAQADSTAGTATVGVTLTNASLSSAVSAAGSDFSAFSQTADAEAAYAQGGRAALFSHLVDSVYAHLDANEGPVTTTVQVSCVRDDEGAWIPQVAGDAAFFSALYGGSDVLSGLAAQQP